MNNEITHNGYVAPSTGMRLRNAREKLGISQQVIAERLCLKISTIRDIEEDRVPSDLTLTFFLGYIRSYAKLVHISEKELSSIIKEYKDKAEILNFPPLKNLSPGKRQRNNNGWLISLIWLTLFVVVSLIGTWWLKKQRVKQEERVVITTNQPSSRLGNIPHRTDAIQTTHHILEIDKNIKTTADHPNTETMNIDPDVLSMNFTDNCWLEITDWTGRILFSGFQHKNDNLNLVGQPPIYKLKIGAPKAIKIQYLGKIVDLSNFIKKKQVAHLFLSVRGQ